jgi:CubicO group peptidase (beta-lactamase class C family)
MELLSAVQALPTTCLLVLRHGRTVFEYGDPAHASFVASIRKSILSLLYGRPVTDGTIDLKSTIGDLGIDDVGGLLPIERQATVRDLLTARSGVYHLAANPTEIGLPDRGTKTPGAEFHYNNWDFNVLGTIYEQRTGRRLFDAVGEELAEPLGFQDFDPARQRMLGRPELSRHLAYHMFLSARDLARIGLLVAQQGHWNESQLVPKQWLAESTKPQTNSNYGYLWWTTDRGILAGGAFGQYLLVLPNEELVIVHRVSISDDVVITRSNEGTTPPIAGVNLRQFWQLVPSILAQSPKAFP